MTIAEVENATGLTRANIRYYEKEGLLQPARGENGYRDYDDEDVRTLQKIKLLRQLRLSVADIRAVECGERPLPEAAEKQLSLLQHDIQESEQAKTMCEAICADRAEWENLDAEKYLSLAALAVHQRGEDAAEKDRIPPAGHPWRRYLARGMDLSLYGLPVTLIVLRILRINVAGFGFAANLLYGVLTGYVGYGLMLLLEPLLLASWGTTPGKWLLGLCVRDEGGAKLSRARATERTWGLFKTGLGYGIPLYILYRYWDCYCTCTKTELDYDADNECMVVARSETMRVRQVIGYLTALACYIAAVVGIVFWSELPPHRGELTLAEYVANCNDYLGYNGYNKSVKKDGSWDSTPDDSNNMVISFLGEDAAIQMTVETGADGFVSSVTVTAEGGWVFGGEARAAAFYSFAVSHEKRGMLSVLQDPALKTLADDALFGEPDGKDRVQADFGSLTIISDCEHSGFSTVSLNDNVPRHYKSVYTIRKK